jgi:hypothetical protein
VGYRVYGGVRVWGTVLVRVPCVRRGTCVGVLCGETVCRGYRVGYRVCGRVLCGVPCVWTGNVWGYCVDTLCRGYCVGTVFLVVPCVRRGTCVGYWVCGGTVCTEGYVCVGYYVGIL